MRGPRLQALWSAFVVGRRGIAEQRQAPAGQLIEANRTPLTTCVKVLQKCVVRTSVWMFRVCVTMCSVFFCKNKKNISFGMHAFSGRFFGSWQEDTHVSGAGEMHSLKRARGTVLTHTCGLFSLRHVQRRLQERTSIAPGWAAPTRSDSEHVVSGAGETPMPRSDCIPGDIEGRA